jgi:integrase
VLDVLRVAVDNHKPKDAKPDDYMFAGERFRTPLNLANLARRVIKSKIAERGVPWLGWHAFRRGLASNLSSLGVHPRVIQAILRHSDVRTTMQFYVKELDGQSREGLQRLGDVLAPFGLPEGTQEGTQVKPKKS